MSISTDDVEKAIQSAEQKAELHAEHIEALLYEKAANPEKFQQEKLSNVNSLYNASETKIATLRRELRSLMRLAEKVIRNVTRINEGLAELGVEATHKQTLRQRNLFSR